MVELVTSYLEEALPATDRDRIESHLAWCPPCRTYVEQMRQTVRWLGQLPAETIATETKGSLLAMFGGWQRDWG